jgi:hypothetical protein
MMVRHQGSLSALAVGKEVLDRTASVGNFTDLCWQRPPFVVMLRTAARKPLYKWRRRWRTLALLFTRASASAAAIFDFPQTFSSQESDVAEFFSSVTVRNQHDQQTMYV